MTKTEFIKIPATIKLMSSIKDNDFLLDITTRIDMTYDHAKHIMYLLEKDKYIEREKDGRKQLITLTKKGIELKKACIVLANFYGKKTN